MRKPSQRGRSQQFASRIANLLSTTVILTDLAETNTFTMFVRFIRTNISE